MPASAAYQVLPVTLPGPFSVRETPGPAPPRPRLLDRVRAALRARHYSRVPRRPTSRGSSGTSSSMRLGAIPPT
jgi:hypothetical protein